MDGKTGAAFLPELENPGACRIQSVLGPDFKVVEFSSSTHTAADAAADIGCDVK